MQQQSWPFFLRKGWKQWDALAGDDGGSMGKWQGRPLTQAISISSWAATCFDARVHNKESQEIVAAMTTDSYA